MQILSMLWLLAIFMPVSDADALHPHSQDQGEPITIVGDAHTAEGSLLASVSTAIGVIDPVKWTAAVASFFHQLTHATRLHAAASDLPDTDSALVAPMVLAAVAEETPRAPAALLVALAWGESRFDQRAQPLCGVLQVNPIDVGRPMSDCAVWRGDVRLAVRAGVTEIEMMMADHRVAGDLRRALLYRACGNKAFDGTCDAKKYAWVKAAIARYRQLERAMTRAATS